MASDGESMRNLVREGAHNKRILGGYGAAFVIVTVVNLGLTRFDGQGR